MMLKRAVAFFSVLLFAFVFWKNVPLEELRRKRGTAQPQKFSSERVDLHYFPGRNLEAKIPDTAKRIERRLVEAEQRLRVKLNGRLQYYLFKDWEEKGAFMERIAVAHADSSKRAVYCIVNEEINGMRERLEYQILLEQHFGETPGWSRVSAAALAGIWNQKSLDEWMKFLREREIFAPATFPNQERTLSPFIVYPYTAHFWRFVYEKHGLETFLAVYKNPEKLMAYRGEWEATLASIPATKRETPPLEPEFQRGVSYAYHNSVDGGYPTENCRKSLRLLKDNGVEWIAAIPYGFMRAPDSTAIEMPGDHISGESDESMFALASHAKELQMKVMMKPQIWVSRGAWVGRIGFDSEANWLQWERDYRNWILHYAILSELNGSGLFCIGTELMRSTLERPQFWRKLIPEIRKIYDGPLVYASNWGREFENIAFWNDLDYIGLDNYYPVRNSKEDDVPTMKRNFLEQKARVEKVVRRFGRPLIFTEAGYVATDGAGMGSEEGEHRRYNERLQADCYHLLMETYWQEPWFYGIYWWKWFSHPEDRGRRADEHSPHGRPAEEVMRSWYKSGRR